MQAPLNRMLLFPEPKVVQQDNKSTPSIVAIRTKLVFTSPSSPLPSAHLLQVLERWCLRARAHGPGVTHIDVTILPHHGAGAEGADGTLDRGGDYRIEIESPDAIRVQASSRHLLSPALATLAQLVAIRPVRLHLPLLLHDWPQYAWRGLLVDVSRHFIPLPLLRRTLDAMEASRLNVLHLHLTDAASFPLLLRDIVLPDGTPLPLSQLALRGSFHNQSKVYTAEGLSGLVDYAAQRGVTIIPEIDLPAHSYSWGKAFPLLVLPHNATSSKVKSRDMVPFDVSQPLLLPVVRAVLTQVAEIFPSRFLHVGGDEVRVEPWAEAPHVAAWMGEQEPKRSVSELFRAFEASVFEILASLKRRPMVWQGVQDAKAMPVEGAAAVQPWKCWGGLALRAAETAISSGRPVVMSSCWYLDADSDWLTFLAADQGAEALGRLAAQRPGHVRSNNSSAAAAAAPNTSLLLGGEASMWTEKVDSTNFECRVWPRAVAVAARLWGLPPHQGASAALIELTRLKVAAGLRGRAPLHKRVDIEPEEATLLHMGLVHAREVLVSLGVQAAPFVFHHLAANSTTSSAGKADSPGSTVPSSLQQPLVVTTAASEDEALTLLQRFAVSHTLSADQQQQPPVLAGGARMTAQCLSLPQEVQRPVRQRAVRLLQLNVADGAGERTRQLTRWLLDKASQGVILAGLCELNGWDRMQSATDLPNNLELIAVRSAEAGFIHSHLLASREHPYHLGVVSALPFVVLRELGPPSLQRGLLHVYIDALRLHVVVLHLHAHDAAKREDECRLVARLLAPLLKQGARVVVQGDFNTLSEWDAAEHEASGLEGQLRRTDSGHFARLAKKFLSGAGVAYRPMAILLEAGLSDACVEACLPGRGTGPGGGPRWRSGADDAFSRCMSARCSHSVPSNFSGEWPSLNVSAPHPAVRVDFVLLSPALLLDATRGGGVRAGIDGSPTASALSDHLALDVGWDEAQPYDLFR